MYTQHYSGMVVRTVVLQTPQCVSVNGCLSVLALQQTAYLFKVHPTSHLMAARIGCNAQ